MLPNDPNMDADQYFLALLQFVIDRFLNFAVFWYEGKPLDLFKKKLFYMCTLHLITYQHILDSPFYGPYHNHFHDQYRFRPLRHLLRYPYCRHGNIVLCPSLSLSFLLFWRAHFIFDLSSLRIIATTQYCDLALSTSLKVKIYHL